MILRASTTAKDRKKKMCRFLTVQLEFVYRGGGGGGGVCTREKNERMSGFCKIKPNATAPRSSTPALMEQAKPPAVRQAIHLYLGRVTNLQPRPKSAA